MPAAPAAFNWFFLGLAKLVKDGVAPKHGGDRNCLDNDMLCRPEFLTGIALALLARGDDPPGPGEFAHSLSSAGSPDVPASGFAAFLACWQIRSGAIMIPVKNSG